MKYEIILFVSLLFINCHTVAYGKESTCYGSTIKGRLENGVELPSKGNNFVSYSSFAGLLGRTFVHSKVRDAVVEAYKSLETEQPGKIYKYAETGFERGGEFKPHKTHQNGLSVDFIVPVTGITGISEHLPTYILNKYGYNIEFDKVGKYKDFTIDYESLAAHIVALHKASKHLQFEISRVIFDPDLQPYLLATKNGKYIKKNIQLSRKPSWVRHDEHYHVDFKIQCKVM